MAAKPNCFHCMRSATSASLRRVMKVHADTVIPVVTKMLKAYAAGSADSRTPVASIAV